MAITNDRTKEIMERLEKGIQDVFNGEKYESYLKTMAKFHNYSYNNTMLIYLQKPNATLIAGYGSWKKNFNRQVQKGEKGIQILAPAFYKAKVEMEKIDIQTQKPIQNSLGQPVTELVEIEKPYFKPVSVFDISQTVGEPLPELVSELKANVENFDTFYKSLEKVSPFPIDKENITSGAKGYCDITNKRIAIKEDLSEAHTIKTGIHEIAHAILHSDKESFKNTDNRTKEVEAESIAFIVADHFGIDTSDYSFSYIASWSASKELNELKSSLTIIQKTANNLINDIEAAYKEIQLSKENELRVSLEDNEIDLDRERTPENIITEQPNTFNGQMNYLNNDNLKTPIVKIELSEHPAFHAGEILSLHEANARFEAVDKEVLELKNEAAANGEYHPYYKTRFEIKCTYNGQEFTYAGRQDLGDGDGSLINHISVYVDNEYLISDSVQYQAAKDFVSYLNQHDLLQQTKDASAVEKARMEMIINSSASPELRNEAQQHLNYHQAIINYVEKNYVNVNNGQELTEMPNKADYVRELPEKNQVPQKSSIKERMAAAKEKSEKSLESINDNNDKVKGKKLESVK